MATQKNPLDSDFSMDSIGSDADLETAIDDLRGVLKNDADGSMPDLDSFGGDFGAAAGGGVCAIAPEAIVAAAVMAAMRTTESSFMNSLVGRKLAPYLHGVCPSTKRLLRQ